jgi:hypothetical protein
MRAYVGVTFHVVGTPGFLFGAICEHMCGVTFDFMWSLCEARDTVFPICMRVWTRAVCCLINGGVRDPLVPVYIQA